MADDILDDLTFVEAETEGYSYVPRTKLPASALTEQPPQGPNMIQAARLRAMTPDEQRAELERLMILIWGSTRAQPLAEAIDVSTRAVETWRSGARGIPFSTLLLLTIWAEGAPEREAVREVERNWSAVAEHLRASAEQLGKTAEAFAVLVERN